jgi:hypothetical protein
MSLPHLNKDVFVAAMLRSGLTYDDAHVPASRLFFSTAQNWLECDISLVMDRTMVPEFSVDDVGSLAPYGNLVNVHCRAQDSLTRWEAKMHEQHGAAAQAVIDARRHVHDLAREPVDFGCPRIEVDTTNGYAPTFPEIVQRIELLHREARS